MSLPAEGRARVRDRRRGRPHRVLSLGLAMASFLVLPATLRAQTIGVTTWAVASGLPHETVYGLYQDHQGYVWIATENGVSRFDGVVHDVFGVPRGLAHPVARSVFEDRQGRVWITTDGGVNRLENGRLLRFGTGDGLPDPRVYTGLAARDGTVWFGTASGLAAFDGHGFRAYGAESGLPAGRIWTMREDGSGGLWLGLRGGGLAHFDGERFASYGPDEGLPALDVFGLAGDDGNGLWLGTNAGLVHFDGHRFQTLTRADGLPSDRVGALLRDARGRLWFTTFGGGLGRLEEGRVTVFDRAHGLPDDYLTALLQDYEGAIWCGTRAHGAVRLGSEALTTFGRQTGLAAGHVTGLELAPDGTLWVASLEGGLASRDADGHVRRYGAAQGLPEAGLWALLVDHAGRVWVSGYDAVYLFDSRQARRLGSELTGARERLTSLFESANGTVWMGSYTPSGTGLIRWDPARGVTRFGAAEGLRLDEITGFAEDAAGRLWISAYGGLTRFDGERFETFTTASGLPGSTVTTLASDPRGGLWVGTDSGLCLLEQGACRKTYTTRAGLVGDAVRGLAWHGEDLWIGTTAGISVLGSNGLRNFAVDGVLAGSELSIGTLRVATDGTVWFGSNDGAMRLRPDAVAPEPVPPRLHLTRAQAAERDLSGASTSVGHDESNLAFAFVAPSFRGRVVYSQRLVGFDDAWSAPGSVREALYTHLPPGRYRFEARAASGSGPWTDPVAVAFEVRPPLWQRGGFRILVLALVGGLGLAGYRWRIRALRRGQERHLDRLRRLLASVSAINSQLELARVLDRIAEQGAQLVQAEPAGIGLIEDGRVVFRRLWAAGAWEDCLAVLPVGQGAAGRAVETARTVVVSASHAFPTHVPEAHRHAYRNGWMDVPVVSRSGRVVGVLEVRRRDEAPPFGETDCELLESLAHEAAVAIENAGLYRRLGEQNQQLEEKTLMIAESMRELEKLYRQEQEVTRNLQALHRMKSDFMVLTSHEMRTPLTVVLGYVEAWLGGMLGPVTEDQRRALLACQRMVERLSDNFNDITEALQLRQGFGSIETAPTDLAATVRRVVEDLRPFLAERRQRVSVEAPEALVVPADEAKLEMVLVNLVQNAIKFTRDGETIRVVLGEDEAAAHLQIQDPGIGIEPDEADRIFDSFYTGHDVSRHTSGSFSFLARGPGLGLAIARSYVEAHGGRIWSESAGRDQGSTFHVVLPLRAAPHGRRAVLHLGAD